MLLRNFKKLTPKHTILLVLVLLALITSPVVGLSKTLPQLFLAIATTLAADLLLNRLKGTRYFFPEAGLISGLIIALVLKPGSPALIIVVTALLAIASKHFFQTKNVPIFNPAAFGLLISSTIFRFTPGWWGDTLPWLTIVLGTIVVIRIRKELQVLGAIIGLFIILTYLLIAESQPLSLSPYLTLLYSPFFFLFMLPEPMTSLVPYKLSFFFGLLVAILGQIAPPGTFPIPILAGLLGTNLLAFVYRQIKR